MRCPGPSYARLPFDSVAPQSCSLPDHVPRCTLHRRPSGRLPGRPADDGVRLSGDVERRPPMAVTVLCELQVPSLAERPHSDVAYAAPGVEVAMQQAQLRGTRLNLGKAEAVRVERRTFTAQKIDE